MVESWPGHTAIESLHVFEVASRVGSFTKAAELLSVSPSAVSRQITASKHFRCPAV